MTGVDSHGTVVVDDPRNFHALITDLVLGVGNLSLVHSDRIELPGLNATSFSYPGNASGGILTVNAGSHPVGEFRFAGSYTTGSFKIVPLSGGSGIELK